MEQQKVAQTLENTGDYGIVDSVDNVDNPLKKMYQIRRIRAFEKIKLSTKL